MKKTILVVDDEKSILTLFRKFLAEKNFNVVLVESVSKAREALSRQQVDLLVTDLHMPEETGQELIREVKQVYPDLPIIVATGIDAPEAAESVLTMGVYGYIIKPFTQNMVLISVSNALRHHALEQQREAYLIEIENELQTIMDHVAIGLILVTPQLETIEQNRLMAHWFGSELTEHQGVSLPALLTANKQSCNAADVFHTSRTEHCSLQLQTREGLRDFVLTTNPVVSNDGSVSSAVIMFEDQTEKLALERDLKQAQKLETVGQLAAGIAHEINTPVQFVGDNMRFLADGVVDLMQLLGKYDRLCTELRSNPSSIPAHLETIESLKGDLDLDYLKEELPRSIEQSIDGISRIARIVKAMKAVSHPGNDERTIVDIKSCLENSITISRNEWKYVAELRTDFSDSLPTVSGLPHELNQVFINIIVNAAHAIGDQIRNGVYNKGLITVTTGQAEERGGIEISVTDNGAGIPKDIQERIFETFFTTKSTGKGTGQGLSIARSIIVDKHGGAIDMVSIPGAGTTFTIFLPDTAMDPQ